MCAVTPTFEASVDSPAPLRALVAGTLFSTLAAVLLAQRATERRRVQRLAQGMTTELQRLALVAQRTANAVIITDPQCRITWVNDAFERITGYTLAEVKGNGAWQAAAVRRH